MYEVKLDAFEGPLDLLLHLIKKYEIDIYDISMSVLTEQYFNYINNSEDMDINQHGDYLVMASELLRIKSKTLLPEPPAEQEELFDPREDLMRQLLEYQNYKLYADILKEKKEETSMYFVKQSTDLSHFDRTNDVPLKMNLSDLLSAYHKAKSRRKLIPEEHVNIVRDAYTIEMAEEKILSSLKEKEVISFEDFVTFSETKIQIVTLFLAMLEMMKSSKIQVRQHELFGEIEIERGKYYAA